MDHRGRRELTSIWRNRLWVWVTHLRERWWSRVLRRWCRRVRVRAHSRERSRSAGDRCASCSSSGIGTGRRYRRRKITVARSPEGTGGIWPGGGAIHHAMWTNEQGEDDLWIRSKADIQVGLEREKKRTPHIH